MNAQSLLGVSFETWLAYLATVSVVTFVPGPSVLLAATRALENGITRSLATVAGDLSANVVQMLAAAFGIGALVAKYPRSLEVARWVGVAYLAYLGITLLRSKVQRASDAPRATSSARRLYLEAFGVSISNPKAVVFFAALFPAFLQADAPLAGQLLLLGLTFLTLDGTALILWSSIALRLQRLQPSAHVGVVSGGLLLAASLGLALK